MVLGGTCKCAAQDGSANKGSNRNSKVFIAWPQKHQETMGLWGCAGTLSIYFVSEGDVRVVRVWGCA